jgi:hypothetical protein
MPWIRFEDNFAEHPKVLSISDAAFRLHVRAIGYCSRHLTDGAVSQAAVRSLSAGRSTRLAAELVKSRMWTVTDDGFLIHDYLEYQPSRSDTLDIRRKRAAAGRAGASARADQMRSKPRAIR